MAQRAQTDPGDSIAAVGRSWGFLLCFGIVSVLAGILIVADPGGTVLAIAILFGIWLFVAGIFRIVEAIAASDGSGGARVMLALLGVLSIMVGVFMMRHTYQSVAIIAFLIGLFWLIGGVIEFFVAITHREMDGRGWRIFMGILSAVAGIVVLAEPAISLATLAWIMGIWFIVYGVMEIVLAFQVRKLRTA